MAPGAGTGTLGATEPIERRAWTVAGIVRTAELGAMSLKGMGLTRRGVTGASACGRICCCAAAAAAPLGGLLTPVPGLSWVYPPGCPV